MLLDKKKKCPPEFQHGSLSLGSSDCNTHWQGGKSSMRYFTFVIRLDGQRKPQRLSLHSLIKLGKSFIFLGSKITADDDCSLEIKRRLLLGRKAMTNPDSILKSRDITLPTKVCLVKAKILPVVVYGCESWTIKKVECRRIDALELWCWRRLLRDS